MTTWTHERARVAAIARHTPNDERALAEARRDLRAARAEEYIREVVGAAPPLTDDQCRRLAALLTAAEGAADG